jgi:acetyl/propionyl-CoA carboxylase alpha subunit
MDGILSSLEPEPLSKLNRHVQFGLVSFLKATSCDNESNIWDGKGEFTNWRQSRSIHRKMNLSAGSDELKVGVDSANNTFTIAPEEEKGHKHHPMASLISSKIVSDNISDQLVRCIVLDSVVDIDGHRVTGTTAVQMPPSGLASVDVWFNSQIGEDSTHYHFNIQTKIEGTADSSGSSHPLILSPMPGKIVKVHAKEGATVKKGDAIAVLEAMKMEHVVYAPCNGSVYFFWCGINL